MSAGAGKWPLVSAGAELVAAGAELVAASTGKWLPVQEW